MDIGGCRIADLHTADERWVEVSGGFQHSIETIANSLLCRLRLSVRQDMVHLGKHGLEERGEQHAGQPTVALQERNTDQWTFPVNKLPGRFHLQAFFS